MTIRIASPRVVAFTTVVAGVIISCSSDAPSPAATTAGAAGIGGMAGSGGVSSGVAGPSAGSTTTSAGTASSVAGTTSSTAGTAGAAGSGGASGGTAGTAGSGGAGTAGVSTTAGAGTGGTGVVEVPQVCNVSAPGKGDGQIDYQRWLNVPGTSVTQIPVDTAPSTTAILTQLRQPDTGLDNFGARIRGYLTAPLGGVYRFWVAGDDNCAVWLGTSDDPASKVRIAYFEGEFDGWTNDQQWNKFTTQKSADITLVQGKRYYLEVLHKDGVNLDHVTVGWQLPGESGLLPCEIVPGSALSRFGDDGAGGAGGAGGGGP